MDNQTPLTVADLQAAFADLSSFVGTLVISCSLSGLLFGIMLGWYLQSRYQILSLPKDDAPFDLGDLE